MIAVRWSVSLVIISTFSVGYGHIWSQMTVPPYIPCTLPLCDPLCLQLEQMGQVCPRSASTNFKIYGVIPSNQSCMAEVKNWISGPQPSNDDPSGCGPCLLTQEYSTCYFRNGGRGFNAGGPPARYGHTLLTYKTPIRSRYIGATVLILFGGIDRDDNFLNDVWFRCVDNCPLVSVGMVSYDKYGIATSHPNCKVGSCYWEEVDIVQTYRDWFEQKDTTTNTLLRRGLVPARPAGRSGHTAVLTQVISEDGDGLTDVMTIFGGISPNCTDYCPDIWNFDIMSNFWIINYGEWYGIYNEWQTMWDYSIYNVSTPSKRWGHTAVMAGGYMFVWGGQTNGSSATCCGYDYDLCGQTNHLLKIFPSPDCPYLDDLWVVNLKSYVPFEVLQSSDKHATQSSTIGTGVARLAVDGNTDGTYSDTWNNSVTMTNAESQAWWQVDLGGSVFVSKIVVFNRVDAFSERLENFYVLLSTDPLVSNMLQDVLEDPEVHKIHVISVDGSVALYPLVNAQYCRIQLAGTNFLSLAEVEVYGYDPIQDWQHMEGIKRWTKIQPLTNYPFGRIGATAIMISNRTVLLYGGYVKENPYFLNDFWTAILPRDSFNEFKDPIDWQQFTPEWQQPINNQPEARYFHSASFSPVCSLGYEIEESVIAGNLVLDSLDQGVLPVYEYPGLANSTAWCRGQVIFFGGGTAAVRDPTDKAYPSGYLGDMWIYNVSSGALSEVLYSLSDPHPVRRRQHATAIYNDKLYLFGGSSSECVGSVCGDFWFLNVSGQYSCPNMCSDHGVCEWGFCICDPGFKDVDCSGMTCPGAKCQYSYKDHWLDCIECSGQGTCYNNGTCICDVGYRGEACEVLACPGACSGHGTCKIGGTCDCDDYFGGPDCFVAFCPNNCTTWSNGYDTGTQGDCVVTREPPCCGIEPSCKQVISCRSVAGVKS